MTHQLNISSYKNITIYATWIGTQKLELDLVSLALSYFFVFMRKFSNMQEVKY